MSLVEKFGNVLGDRKEEVVTTLLLDKKSSTKDFEKGADELSGTPLLEKKYLTKGVENGTDELADMKNAVVTILSKGLDKLEVQSKIYTGWFKLDSGFKKNLQFIQNSINKFLKRISKI